VAVCRYRRNHRSGTRSQQLSRHPVHHYDRHVGVELRG